ncbi:uncharacterized protein LOC122886391 isoform X3 [Siniperca chuatsi]|nr:uncharacterized protein LOC122886391 isoform X3 [Siniperca chuatsi]
MKPGQTLFCLPPVYWLPSLGRLRPRLGRLKGISPTQATGPRTACLFPTPLGPKYCNGSTTPASPVTLALPELSPSSNGTFGGPPWRPIPGLSWPPVPYVLVGRHHIDHRLVYCYHSQFPVALFWPSFGATISLSSGFHPQSNGQTERANQDLEAALRCVAASNPSSWSSQLPWVEYAHNSLTCAASGLSPFESSLGYQPPLFPAQESELAVPSVQHHLRRCRRVWKDTRAALLPLRRRYCGSLPPLPLQPCVLCCFPFLVFPVCPLLV